MQSRMTKTFMCLCWYSFQDIQNINSSYLLSKTLGDVGKILTGVQIKITILNIVLQIFITVTSIEIQIEHEPTDQ